MDENENEKRNEWMKMKIEMNGWMKMIREMNG
jgi:hypothetical protein